MNKVTALSDLFTNLFNPGELRLFLGRNTTREVMHALPSQSSHATLAYEAAGALERRGEVTPGLFAALRREIPGRAAEIDNVEALWTSGAAAPRPQPRTTEQPSFRWLRDSELDAVFEALVDAGLVHQTTALVGGISPSYVAMHLTGGPPSAQLLALLQSMNGVKSLGDGSVPLARFLRNAALLTRGQTHESTFNEARGRIDTA